MNANNKSELMSQLNRETAKMAWAELEKFFAHGSVVYVDASLDLIEAAAEMALDNKVQIGAWMDEQKFGLAQEQQAEQWAAENTTLWAVVVAPWVLVQPVKQTIQ